ncbi:MAG: hypothetical protein M1826_004758 [Phylliscum demangeonii]|nr:MAG: hypothetical protein M1826_004758 [Phylliscum demangeonii]
MPVFGDALRLVARAAADSASGTSSAPAAAVVDGCDSGIGYDGRLGLRISSIFVILIGSLFGTLFPLLARRRGGGFVPDWVFFGTKYFGSGVIVATAFIHLLAPATQALQNPCLTGPITDYAWAEGIALMAVFVLFFIELMTLRYAHFGPAPAGDDDVDARVAAAAGVSPPGRQPVDDDGGEMAKADGESPPALSRRPSHMPGEDHFGHARVHAVADIFAAELTGIFILEFGVIFHSIFIGLTLAVAGSEFVTLYVVLVFHQTFEGLGLGSRLAMAPWPANRRRTPYLLAVAYGLTTPIAIGIGLGVRARLDGSTGLIVNGVFDSISAGILLYTGLVELMAHEFMFSETMRRAPLRVVLAAFGCMVLGAGLMALLGKWA